MIRLFPTPDGYFANLYSANGCIDATLHRRPAPGIPWRLCYAACTGAVKHLQGLVVDTLTLGDLKGELTRLDHRLDPPPPPPAFSADVPGPWAVDAVGDTWCVIHAETRRTKRIGPVGRLRIRRSRNRHNYFDLAIAEANRRNQALAAKSGASP